MDRNDRHHIYILRIGTTFVMSGTCFVEHLDEQHFSIPEIYFANSTETKYEIITTFSYHRYSYVSSIAFVVEQNFSLIGFMLFSKYLIDLF